MFKTKGKNMQNQKNAFTMIELVFVIVVLGILAAIAVPKFAATRTDAQISKARADISAIRSSIVSERQVRLIKGDSSWVTGLSSGTTTLFTGPDNNHTLLMYGITASTNDGHWSTTDAAAPFKKYRFMIQGQNCNFTYNDNNGTFNLDNTQPAICDNLVN